MATVKEVQEVLEKLKTVKLPERKDGYPLNEFREVVAKTKEGQEVMKELNEMGVNKQWLEKHGFIVAVMCLKFD